MTNFSSKSGQNFNEISWHSTSSHALTDESSYEDFFVQIFKESGTEIKPNACSQIFEHDFYLPALNLVVEIDGSGHFIKKYPENFLVLKSPTETEPEYYLVENGRTRFRNETVKRMGVNLVSINEISPKSRLETMKSLAK